jgi:isoleucyl-tRNA synthetase
LRRAGLAREAIRLIQEARKAAGLAVSDRIEVWWRADSPEVARALRDRGGEVAAEVLATGWYEGRPPADLPTHRDGELTLTFWLRGIT